MEIAILGYQREQRNEVEAEIRACLGRDSSILLKQYGMEELLYPVPTKTLGAFVIIDNAQALITARKVATWRKNFPLVMVSSYPQYVLEGIRLEVRHYILFPLEEEEVREALRRIGVKM